MWRKAGSLATKILKGTRTADLPVQAPTRYELILNLKAAKTLGLAVPPTLLARVDPTRTLGCAQARFSPINAVV